MDRCNIWPAKMGGQGAVLKGGGWGDQGSPLLASLAAYGLEGLFNQDSTKARLSRLALSFLWGRGLGVEGGVGRLSFLWFPSVRK